MKVHPEHTQNVHKDIPYERTYFSKMGQMWPKVVLNNKSFYAVVWGKMPFKAMDDLWKEKQSHQVTVRQRCLLEMLQLSHRQVEASCLHREPYIFFFITSCNPTKLVQMQSAVSCELLDLSSLWDHLLLCKLSVLCATNRQQVVVSCLYRKLSRTHSVCIYRQLCEAKVLSISGGCNEVELCHIHSVFHSTMLSFQRSKK